MTLYEIDKNIEEAFDKAVDPETGEIADEGAYAEFCQLNINREEKIENVGLWIKELKAEAAAIKDERDSLARRQYAAENKAESLKRFLIYALDGEKFKTPKLSVSYKKSERVEIDDITAIPENFLRFKAPEADKVAIKEALKTGLTVPGTRLSENRSMIIK